MLVGCAPDSFKGSMTASEAAARPAAAVCSVLPGAEAVESPISDGGEGFTTAVAEARGARLNRPPVHDQLGRGNIAELAIEPLGGMLVGICDVAATSGLELVPAACRDVLNYHTGGLGELITAALDAGVQRLAIGIGGASTNDGEAGMLAAPGVRFLDAAGPELPPTPAVAGVDATGPDPRLAQLVMEVASEVTNPLFGPQGASTIHGPQQGATPQLVAELDEILAHLVRCSGPEAQRVADLPGSDAAGGLGVTAFPGRKPASLVVTGCRIGRSGRASGRRRSGADRRRLRGPANPERQGRGPDMRACRPGRGIGIGVRWPGRSGAGRRA